MAGLLASFPKRHGRPYMKASALDPMATTPPPQPPLSDMVFLAAAQARTRCIPCRIGPCFPFLFPHGHTRRSNRFRILLLDPLHQLELLHKSARALQAHLAQTLWKPKRQLIVDAPSSPPCIHRSSPVLWHSFSDICLRGERLSLALWPRLSLAAMPEITTASISAPVCAPENHQSSIQQRCRQKSVFAISSVPLLQCLYKSVTIPNHHSKADDA